MRRTSRYRIRSHTDWRARETRAGALPTNDVAGRGDIVGCCRQKNDEQAAALVQISAAGDGWRTLRIRESNVLMMTVRIIYVIVSLKSEGSRSGCVHGT